MTALATRTHANGTPAATGLAPIALTIQDIWMMAEQVAASRMFKGIDTPQKAFTLMMISHAEGIHPIKAMQIYDIIEGKPAMKSSVIQARFIQNGGKIEIVRADDIEARAIFSHPTLQPKPIELSYTMDMAKKANRAGKDVYKNDGQDMLWWRLVSKTINKIDPGIKSGLPSVEEARETAMLESAPPVDVQAKIEAAEAANGHSRPTAAAEVPVIGYEEEGFDPRNYKAVIDEAVAAVNANVAPRVTEVLGAESLPVWQVKGLDLHNDLFHRAVNKGIVTDPKPATLAGAIKILDALYKRERAWVRSEIGGFFLRHSERLDAAFEEAAAKAEAAKPDHDVPDPEIDDDGVASNPADA